MKRTYLTLIIMMLVIGFAAVSTNLILSGTLKVGFNGEEFEEGVVFTKANPINGTASIQNDGKSINYETYKLDNIGEESTLDYDITNKSNQYDAEVTINCELKDTSSTYEEYIELLNEDLKEKFTLSAGATEKGRVKVKLKKSYVTNDNTQIQFTCTIVATAKEKEETVEYKPETIYTEIALNGTDPVLEGNGISTVSLEEKEEKKLIPVTIDDDGTVKYADVTEKWYDYENQEWANAVILSNYNHIPKVGEVIPEEDIESYFVWIPKYRYKLWNMGEYNSIQPEGTEYEEKSQRIEIEFGTENTKDDESNLEYKECETPGKSGENGQCHVGYWMTHPAFTSFGDIKGFWVGKFETGYNQSEDNSLTNTTNWSKEGAEKNLNDASKIIIKPNVYSWRNITVGNAFNASYNYQRNLDSHMMKNTEWGAVAYLSHSKYGTCKNNICTEVRINNSGNFVTGVSAINAPNDEYNTYKDYDLTIPNQTNSKSYTYPNSGIASTTLNNTGIFDMSGGSWEHVLGYIRGYVESSGLTENNELKDENSKYFDKYVNIKNTEYNKRILGDATGEMGPFKKINVLFSGSYFDDYAMFVSIEAANSAWFNRGGGHAYGTGAGIFEYNTGNGGTYNSSTFRIVLAPTN